MGYHDNTSSIFTEGDDTAEAYSQTPLLNWLNSEQNKGAKAQEHEELLASFPPTEGVQITRDYDDDTNVHITVEERLPTVEGTRLTNLFLNKSEDTVPVDISSSPLLENDGHIKGDGSGDIKEAPNGSAIYCAKSMGEMSMATKKWASEDQDIVGITTIFEDDIEGNNPPRFFSMKKKEIDGCPPSGSGSDKKSDELGLELGEQFGVDVNGLRTLWVVFQCTWPTLLMMFDAVSISALVAPGVAFWLVVICVINGGILDKFGWRDFSPTAFWAAFFVISKLHDESRGRTYPGQKHYVQSIHSRQMDVLKAYVYLLLFLMVGRLALKAQEMGPRRLWELFIIKLSGIFDERTRSLNSYLQEDEVYDGETPQRPTQYLQHLEDLAREGKLKRPTWIILVLGALIVWEVGFLFYMMRVSLSPGPY